MCGSSKASPQCRCRDEVKGASLTEPGTGSPSPQPEACCDCLVPFLASARWWWEVRVLLAAGWEPAQAAQPCRGSSSFTSSEPCGELAAVAHPSPAGDGAAVAGTAGSLASWLALWLTKGTPGSQQYTQLPGPCPALTGAE